MTGYFQIGEFHFYPQKNEIHHGEKILKVRPKTADLLTVLLEANGSIVSKSELLYSVWSDVATEEYVVFQSIAELRKIFGDTKVIKTHPRKGYSIIVLIHKYHEKAEPKSGAAPDELTSVTKNISINSIQTRKTPPRLLWGMLAVVLVVITIFGINFEFSNDKKLVNSGSILVLPVTNRIESEEHMWLRYGGMDSLIKYLQPHIKAQVIPTEMVLDSIKRAGIWQESIDDAGIARLFEVTGAQVIVHQAISGVSGQFQLVYSIYEQHDVTRGVLVGDDTGSLLLQLNSLLLQSMGVTQHSVTHSHKNNFANALMTKAIDETLRGNDEHAVTMYKAVLIAEPKNVLAIRMLIKSLVLIGKYVEAESVAADAVKHVMQNADNKNLGRLFFWQAVSVTQQHKYDEALSVLHYAKAKSEHTQDLFYLAAIFRVAAQMYLHKQQYNMARLEIDKALSLYKSFDEPYGQVSMYIELGELELAVDDKEKARSAFAKAHELANKSKLLTLINLSKEWLNKTQ